MYYCLRGHIHHESHTSCFNRIHESCKLMFDPSLDLRVSVWVCISNFDLRISDILHEFCEEDCQIALFVHTFVHI